MGYIEGQEKFLILTKVFYKNIAVYILLYDITRKESFEELENFLVEDIQNSVCSDICKIIIYKIDIVLAIVGKKSDDYENEKVQDVDAKNWQKL